MKKKFAVKAVLLFMFILFSFTVFIMPQLSAEQKLYEPRLIFKKSVILKKYKDGQVYTETHTVQRGEHLWKILREHYKMSNSKIAFYCRIAKAVNTEVEDIDKIHPNQNILVPYKYIKEGNEDVVSADTPVLDVEYVVRAGEHLAKILRKQYKIPEDIIFSSVFRKLFKAVNPGIEDINKLEKGQKIIIPSEILAMKSFNRDDFILERQTEKISSKKTSKNHIEPSVNEIAAFPVKQSREETRIKDLISQLATSFEGTDNRTGEAVISLQGRSAVTLDYAKFPLYEFPWGKKILFDYGGTMPSGIKQVISSEWENVEVVAVNKKDDLELILDKVLDACDFYKVEKGGEYIVNRDNIQISVSGNWIIFKDNTLKNVFVVNLIDNEQSLTPELEPFLTSMGLKIVDIQLGKNENKVEKHSHAKKTDYSKVQSQQDILTDAILNTIGQKYHKNYKTNIFQNMYKGFSLEVIADRMFEKDGTLHLIDFNSLPEKISEIITEQGIELLKVDPQEDNSSAVVKKVLDFCGEEYQDSPVSFNYDKGKKSSIKLTIPGYLVERQDGRVLFTHISLQESIAQFLADMNVRILQY